MKQKCAGDHWKTCSDMLIIEEIAETREANMAEWFPLPGGLDSPHPGHGKHLCVAHVMNWIQTNLDEYKDIVRDGKYVCKQCGRVAKTPEYLCDPDTL
jgi:hypothetical protein